LIEFQPGGKRRLLWICVVISSSFAGMCLLLMAGSLSVTCDAANLQKCTNFHRGSLYFAGMGAVWFVAAIASRLALRRTPPGTQGATNTGWCRSGIEERPP